MERRRFLGYAGLASMAVAGAEAAAQDAKGEQRQAAKGVRITVLKKSVQREFGQYRGGEIQACSKFEEGQQYLLKSPWIKPDGFCDWAWADIRSFIHIVYAGEMEQFVACCTDGFRPVFFHLERVT